MPCPSVRASKRRRSSRVPSSTLAARSLLILQTFLVSFLITCQHRRKPGAGVFVLADSDLHGRYSFSLTTFSPSGRLDQATRAARAASLGPPVIAVSLPPPIRGVILVAPQVLPSPLIRDDGTPRFVSVTPTIALTHSGVGADGRVAIQHALKVAIEYKYAYDEDIPLDALLEELAGLFQRYTSKPGARPFGCALLVCSLARQGVEDCDERGDDNNSNVDGEPGLYRIDPSGAVEEICGGVAWLGRGIGTGGGIDGLLRRMEERGYREAETLDEARDVLVGAMREELAHAAVKEGTGKREEGTRETILSAFFSPGRGFGVERLP